VKQRKDAETRREQLQKAAAALASIPVYQELPSLPPPPPSIPTNGIHNDTNGSSSTTEESSQQSTTSQSAKCVVISVNVGTNGLGVVVVPTSNNQMSVKEYRNMPEGVVNPSKEAGVLIGDIIEEINGAPLTSPEESVKILRGARGWIKFTIRRQ
jgi:hypothetical protein